MYALRGLAILTIVMYHIAGANGYAPSNSILHGFYEAGFMGVDVLFFTTGFVLFLPVLLNGSLGDLRSFAIRRWFRVGPAYYVSLLVVIAALPLIAPPPFRPYISTGPQYVLIHFLFLDLELIPHDLGFVINAPVWTLSVDFIVYVLFPLIVIGYRRSPILGLILALGITQLWRVVELQLGLFHPTDTWIVQFPFFAGDVASGMTAALLFVRLREQGVGARHPRACTAIALASAAALLVIAYVAGSDSPHRAIPTMGIVYTPYREPAATLALFPLCLIVFVVAMALAPRRTQLPLTTRPLMRFTDISYSVYLYHLPIIYFFLVTLKLKVTHEFPLMMTAVVFPATLLVATISYVLVERPARRYGRTLAKRIARAPARQEPVMAIEPALVAVEPASHQADA